jgi:hypothetical protein
VRVEVREIDPWVVGAAASLTTVLSLGLLGGLVAGPAGALAGGAAGIVADGVARFNGWRAGRSGGAPPPPPRGGGGRMTFATVTQTPFGSTMSVTSNAGGRVRTVTVRSQGPGGGLGSPDFATGTSAADGMILRMLLLNALSQGVDGNAAERMTYEELLERFGVGTERRGASRATIDALPLTRLDGKALEEMEENQKTCNICLEDFKDGQEMRKLDCSHAFHRECIDRWLSQVASCPICKREIHQAAANSAEQQRPSSSSRRRTPEQQCQAPQQP